MSIKGLPDASVLTATGMGNHFRLVVRLVCLIAAVLCLLPIGGRNALLPLVPALSPFVAVASILTTKTIRPMLGLGLITGMVVFYHHRWCCRWVCPMGLCLDGTSFLGRGLKRKPPQAVSIGRWVLALTFGGAILGYPLFLWCDPLALFSSLFLLTERGQLLNGIVSSLVVTLLLILSLLWPHVWCRGLCPLGAFQDLLSRMFRSLRSWRGHPTCRGHPGRVVPKASRLRIAGGTPATHPRQSDLSGQHVARRTMLGLVAGAASASTLRLTGRESSRPPRPPGAVDELFFKGLCSRCGNCVRSCPYSIIRRETGQYGLAGILTPVLTFDKDYCREDCIRCTRVCPSGALRGVDIKNKPDVHIGLARVDMSLCLLGEDRECSACMRWCPYNAIRYVFSEAEYTLVPVIDAGRCNGCGACEAACPTRPRKAIRVFAGGK